MIKAIYSSQKKHLLMHRSMSELRERRARVSDVEEIFELVAFSHHV
jgi:Trm5-related predicted tRNA methylase